jgi:hypothetical protein
MTPADSDHDEWLLDESLEETVPASDAPSPARPGSLLATRYAAEARTRKRVGSSRAFQPWIVGALLGGVVAGVLIGRRRDTP